MQPNRTDHTVRWHLADYLRLQAVAKELGFGSTGALIRFVVLHWLREYTPHQDAATGGSGDQ